MPALLLTKMDTIWVATARLIYPEISNDRLVTFAEILAEIDALFPGTQITPIMVTHHLVSWIDRLADKTNPARGGSRNRYLFKTLDSLTPHPDGRFRLYKKRDGVYDGKDKTSKLNPEINMIPREYRFLVEWYQNQYLAG